MLTVVDSFTRECPAVEVDTGLSSGRVTRVLDWIISQRGKPEVIRCDNGLEFTSRHFIVWCEERQITLLHIQPGRPMQNGHVESFNGRFRDECLNHNWFTTLTDARKRSSGGVWNTTGSGHTAAWRIERQRNSPKPALSPPTGWGQQHPSRQSRPSQVSGRRTVLTVKGSLTPRQKPARP